MYKKVWCTCKVVVLRNKPIDFLTSSLPSPSSLLKLPVGVPKQWNGGHVGVLKPSCGSWSHFLCKLFSFVSMNLHRYWPREWKRSVKCCYYYKGLMLLCFRRRVYWPIMVTLFSTFGSCTIRQAENIIFVSSKGFNCVKDDLKYNLILMILHIDPTII